MKINNCKVCKYRNCNKTIEGRPNKLYCNRRCKSNEKHALEISLIVKKLMIKQNKM